MNMLKRFWFTFEESPYPSVLNIGCGVTAFNYADAVGLIRKYLSKGEDLPRIVECSENVVVSDLDKKHVLPNIGVASNRGIWFPQTSIDEVPRSTWP